MITLDPPGSFWIIMFGAEGVPFYLPRRVKVEVLQRMGETSMFTFTEGKVGKRGRDFRYWA